MADTNQKYLTVVGRMWNFDYNAPNEAQLDAARLFNIFEKSK